MDDQKRGSTITFFDDSDNDVEKKNHAMNATLDAFKTPNHQKESAIKLGEGDIE